MLKDSAQTTTMLFIRLVEVFSLATLRTVCTKYLTGQVFVIPSLYNHREQVFNTYTQGLESIFNLLSSKLATLSTIPTNTNKLYKGINVMTINYRNLSEV